MLIMRSGKKHFKMELVSMGLIKDGLLLNCGGSAGPICYALHQGEDQQMGSGHNDNTGRGKSLLGSVLPSCKTTIIVQLSSNGNGSIILIWTSTDTTQQVSTKGALEKMKQSEFDQDRVCQAGLSSLEAQPGRKIGSLASLDKMAAAPMIFSECIITITMIKWVQVA